MPLPNILKIKKPMNAFKPDNKTLLTKVDTILKTGINRIQILTDKSRLFVTGFALSFDQSLDPYAYYRIGLTTGDGQTVINKVPVWFFNKDHSKLEKEKVFFPIDAPANGATLYAEIERFPQAGDVASSVSPLKIDLLIATSKTRNKEKYILQHEVILKPTEGSGSGFLSYGLNLI